MTAEGCVSLGGALPHHPTRGQRSVCAFTLVHSFIYVELIIKMKFGGYHMEPLGAVLVTHTPHL